MSKKSKKEPLAATEVATAANAIVNEPNVQPALRLTEMQASVRAHIDNKAKAGLGGNRRLGVINFGAFEDPTSLSCSDRWLNIVPCWSMRSSADWNA